MFIKIYVLLLLTKKVTTKSQKVAQPIKYNVFEKVSTDRMFFEVEQPLFKTNLMSFNQIIN